jgi:cell division protein FtsI (penicillin-binding protein 3)
MSQENKQQSNIKKFLFLLAILLLAFIILAISVSHIIKEERNIPSLRTTKKDLAVRGNIFSADGFKIATSRKIFAASIDTRSLEKKDLFITLFSIYSDIEENILREKIDNKNGHLVLSNKIDQRTAKNLESLAFKLRRLSVFKSIKINGTSRLYGLDVYEIGEERIYPYKDALSPIIGFMRVNNNKAGKKRVSGVDGIEKEYDKRLNNMQNGILRGDKDILSYIIFNKDSKIIQRRDGQDLKLSIPLKLQRNIELMLDRYKKKLECKEILVSVMDSKSGKIIALASSNRYDPNNIRQEDMPNLKINATWYNFEPGSVIKPITIAIALDNGTIRRNQLFFAHNKGKRNTKGEFPKGKYIIGKHRIGDDHRFKTHYLTLEEVFIFSSNIGTLKIANRLSAEEFYYGFKDFGLSQKTGIDLPTDNKGLIHELYQYQAGEKDGVDNIYKATDSYGQGITSTFMQVLKAYSTFNNGGKIVSPYIVGNVKQEDSKQIISEETANKIKELLIATVEKGTGTKAKIEGLEVGGKTGTANIVENGRYQKKYMSSFFGFVNGKNNKYTIGVTVNEPISTGKNWYYYYASHSAVPVFRETAKILTKLNYLEPFDIESN